MIPIIRGAGGGKESGGGGSSAPVEAPDSLRSLQFARVLDLVSEGEIGGLIDGAKSAYLDGVPLQNADGSLNFTGTSVNAVYGSQSQNYMPGFSDVESEFAVGTLVTTGSSVTRTITDADVNKVRVTLAVPQLTQQDTTTGNLNGATVNFAIDLQIDGGGFVTMLEDAFSGKTVTRYQRSYEIGVSGSPPWDIRVRRLTADSGSSALVDKMYWDSYTEIIDSKFTYPNSAIIAVEIDSAQFNRIPTRGYDILGIKIRIPINYNPITREYSGSWDGNFTVAWSDNPAWVLYDLLTNTRYGLGNFIDADQIDKWSLYEIGQYCDALVPDGFGGYEPRFTCNLFLQTRAEAMKVVNNVASIFRGMSYWGAGAVVPVADMPSDPIAMFNKANVIDGRFTYQGSARNTRHTVALVSWNDPEDGYKSKVEYVEDTTGIERFGVNETEVVAFGCTSRGQAHRLGKWLLYSERLETDTVTFRAGLDGVLVSPGDVIQTQDAARAGKRFGGRLVSVAGTSNITIDQAITIEVGKTYYISVLNADGEIQSSVVQNAPGSVSAILVSPAFATAPQVNSIWVIAASDLVPQTWRVISTTEIDKAQYEVIALQHTATKYDEVELNIVLESPPTSSIQLIPAAVTDLTATEMLYQSGPGIVSNRLTLSWFGTTGRYRVSYRGEHSNLVRLTETASQTIDIDGIAPDRYQFQVVQLSAIGLSSQPNVLNAIVYGKTAPPNDIVNFTVIKSSGFALAQWDLPVDLDVIIGGFVVIRHSPLTTGAEWEDGIGLQDFPGAVVQGFVPLISGTYMAKALDSSGNFSENPVSFVLTEGMITGFTTVGTTTQHPTFTGTKTNVAVVGVSLQLDGATLIDDILDNIDDWPMGDLGGIAPTGSYDFDTYLDLTTVATRRFEADITAVSFDTGDTIDVRETPIDDWDAVDGDVINDCDVTLYASITDDDPAGTPTWGPYHPFMVSDFTCRAAQFRLDFVSGQSTHNIAVSELVVHAKIPA